MVLYLLLSLSTRKATILKTRILSILCYYFQDNSSDAFEDSKMQHNENCGITRYAVCNSGRSNGACKNKGEAIQMVYDKLLTNIAMADEAEIEPDLAATFAEIEETSGLDERTIDWLLHVSSGR